MLNTSRRLLLSLHRRAWRHSKATLILTLLVFIGASFGLNRLQFLLSIDDLIDPDFQTYTGLKNLNAEFKDKNTVLLSVESKTPFTKTFLCDFQGWILKTAQNNSELIHIQSTFGIRQAHVTGNQFTMKSFLDLDCLSKDPETQKISDAFEKIQASPWQGILSSRASYAVSVNFIIFDPEDKKFGTVDVNVVPSLQKSFENDVFKNSTENDNLNIYWGGITTYQSYLRKAFEQTQFLNMMMFLVSMLIFKILLGTWKGGFVFNVTIFISMGITFGLMGFLDIPVDVLTNSTGLMMLVGCLEDFTFVVFGMLRFKWSMRSSLRKFMLPSFFTSLTTAIGFASLVTSDLSTIRRFGLISAFAAMLEWSLVFLVLPAALKHWPWLADIRFTPPRFSLKFTQKNIIPRWLAILLCIPIVIPFIFIDKLTIKDAPDSFFFKNHIVIQTMEHFKKTRGWVTEVSVVFNTNNSETENRQILQQARKNPFVSIVEDSYTTNDYIMGNLDPIDQRTIQSLIDESLTARRLKSPRDTHRAQLFLNTMEMDDIKLLIDQFKDICQNEKCTLVGSLISYNEFSIKILNTLFSSLGLSVILVVLLLLSIKHNTTWSEMFALVASSLWGPLTLLTLFIVLRIPLTFVSCICASLLEGLAGDNAIQFIFSSRKGGLSQSVDALSEGSLIMTIGMTVLISTFMFSTIASIATLGIYILLGVILTFFGDVWILKGLLRK